MNEICKCSQECGSSDRNNKFNKSLISCINLELEDKFLKLLKKNQNEFICVKVAVAAFKRNDAYYLEMLNDFVNQKYWIQEEIWVALTYEDFYLMQYVYILSGECEGISIYGEDLVSYIWSRTEDVNKIKIFT